MYLSGISSSKDDLLLFPITAGSGVSFYTYLKNFEGV